MIRALGVSCHSLEALEAAATEPWVESVHARINPFGMSMDDKPEKVVPVLKQLHAAGKGVVGMKIVGEGRLREELGLFAENKGAMVGPLTIVDAGDTILGSDDKSGIAACIEAMRILKEQGLAHRPASSSSTAPAQFQASMALARK